MSFISKFLSKARVLYLTNLKQNNLNLPLKVKTDQFIICFVLPECLSVKICCISLSDSEANRDGADAESSLSLFFSFSAALIGQSSVGYCAVKPTEKPRLLNYYIKASGSWFTNSSRVLPTSRVIYQPITHRNLWSIAYLLQYCLELNNCY